MFSTSTFVKGDTVVLLKTIHTLRGIFQEGKSMKVLEGGYNFTLIDDQGSLLLQSDL